MSSNTSDNNVLSVDQQGDSSELTTQKDNKKLQVELHGDEQGQNKENRQKILRVDRIWDKTTHKFRYVKTAKPKPNKKFRRTIVTIARRISDRGSFTGEVLVEIRSQHIPGILNDIYEAIEGVNFPSMISLETNELQQLYFAIPALVNKLQSERASESPDPDLILELEAVLEFTYEHYAETFQAIEGFPDNTIDFQTLWSLYYPGTLVFSIGSLEEITISRIRGFPRYYKKEDGSQGLAIPLESVDFNGKYLGIVEHSGKIDGFVGLLPLSRLAFQPFKSCADYESLNASLMLRAEKILSLHGRHLQEYQGHALQEGEKGLEKFNSHGRVMLDPETLKTVHPNNMLVPRLEKLLRREDLSPDRMLMLRPYLYGFSLGDKIWGIFTVSSISNVKWDDSMISSLVLPENTKKHIQTLVQMHSNPSSSYHFDDIVKDKGKGLIGLLVGAPGVGKTLTAEVMAEISHKALYTINSGELGGDPKRVMSKLKHVMELAETWNALLLLDEADVFLTARDNENLARNAITSVFLRHLEYFQGTMLLTTNRLGSFDRAFQSRIHFCIEYPDLDKTARENIWQIFKKRVADSTDVPITLDEDDIARLASQADGLNGRQIKNVMNISQLFAKEQKKHITYESIMKAIDFSQSGWPIKV